MGLKMSPPIRYKACQRRERSDSIGGQEHQNSPPITRGVSPVQPTNQNNEQCQSREELSKQTVKSTNGGVTLFNQT